MVTGFTKRTSFEGFVIVTLMALAIWIPLAFLTGAFDQTDAVKDDMELVVEVKVPYYNYSISNVSMEMQLGNISIEFDIDYYSVSFVLNDDGKYDMKLAVEGLYLNVSIETDQGISGGTITLEEFYFESEVTEATQDAITEAVTGQIEFEQWVG